MKIKGVLERAFTCLLSVFAIKALRGLKTLIRQMSYTGRKNMQQKLKVSAARPGLAKKALLA